MSHSLSTSQKTKSWKPGADKEKADNIWADLHCILLQGRAISQLRSASDKSLEGYVPFVVTRKKTKINEAGVEAYFPFQ